VSKSFAEIIGRLYLQIGTAALLMMVPLAATSTNAMIKRLGAKRWKRLHWLAYPAAIAGVTHYWMEVKADTRIPRAFAIALAILLAYRLLEKRFSFLRRRPPAPRPAATA
jgi:sulfoxide reductase heme-binding subunit YedZ